MHDKTRFECDICGKKFTLAASLKSHFQALHENATAQPQECNQCFRKYKSIHTLKNHQRQAHRNTEEKPKCDICTKTFKLKSNLRSHVKNIHRQTKPHPCTICEKIFNNQNNLTQHMNGFHKESQKMFTCEYCSFTSNAKGRIKAHIKSIHEERIHECDTCEKAFKSKDSMEKHKIKLHL